FEEFVLEQTTPMDEPPSPPDMARLMTLATKYGIDIHGPLPEMPEGFAAEGNPAEGLKELNYRWIKAFNERDWETERAIRGANFQANLSGAKDPMNGVA